MIFGKCSSFEKESREAKIWWTGHKADAPVDADEWQTVYIGEMTLLIWTLALKKSRNSNGKSENVWKKQVSRELKVKNVSIRNSLSTSIYYIYIIYIYTFVYIKNKC